MGSDKPETINYRTFKPEPMACSAPHLRPVTDWNASAAVQAHEASRVICDNAAWK